MEEKSGRNVPFHVQVVLHGRDTTVKRQSFVTETTISKNDSLCSLFQIFGIEFAGCTSQLVVVTFGRLHRTVLDGKWHVNNRGTYDDELIKSRIGWRNRWLDDECRDTRLFWFTWGWIWFQNGLFWFPRFHEVLAWVSGSSLPLLRLEHRWPHPWIVNALLFSRSLLEMSSKVQARHRYGLSMREYCTEQTWSRCPSCLASVVLLNRIATLPCTYAIRWNEAKARLLESYFLVSIPIPQRDPGATSSTLL